MADSERTHLLSSAKIDSSRHRIPKKCDVITVLSWIGLVVACFDKLCVGTVYAANVYLNDLKRTYNYTQTEVEVIVSALNIGLGVSVFPGMCFDRFGPAIPCSIAFILTTGSYLLVWQSADLVGFYQSRSGLIAFYFFLAGFGMGFTFVSSQNTSIVNFDRKWRGKIIGVQDALFGISPVFVSPIYYYGFEITYDAANGIFIFDYPGFMLLLAVILGTNSLLCLAFSRYYRRDTSTLHESSDDTERNISLEPNKSTAECASNESLDTVELSGTRTTDYCSEDASMWQVLKSPHYHLFLWTFVLMVCVDFVCVNNLTISSKSLGFGKYNVIIVILTAGVMFVSSLSTGVLIDRFPGCRMCSQLLSSIVGTVSMLLYIFLGDSFSMFLLASGLMAVPAGIMWVVVPVEISERFHTKHFGRNWGFVRIVQTLLNSPVQYLFGYFYQMNLPPGEIYCFGLHCVRYGYIALLCITLASFTVFSLRCLRSYSKVRNT